RTGTGRREKPGRRRELCQQRVGKTRRQWHLRCPYSDDGRQDHSMTEHEESAAKKAETVLDELVAFKGGQRRDPQVRLARGMAMHQENGIPLIVSAPTGVGKSYAGFAASLASGKKTLIATHT